jgi:hypothetical protein
MRAKQSTSQLTQSSLAQTILPSAANDANRRGRKSHDANGRGRRSRAAEASAPVVEAPAAVVEAPPPAAQAPAPVWSPPPAAQAPAPVWSPSPPPAMPAATPDWGVSASRFGNAPPPGYPVNYPATPGFPPQPHYADSPAVDYLPPVTGGHWVPQHAAPHHGGTQTAPPAYGPPPFGAPGYQGYPPPQVPSSSKTRIGVIVAVCVVLVIGVLYAVAKPVFGRQHKPVPVTLVLPPSLEGSPKLNTAALQQLESTAESTVFPAGTVFSEPQAAFYGNGPPSFGVMAAKITSRPTPAEAASYWNAVAHGASDGQVTLTKVPPGALGGTTECGLALGDVPFTVCFSLDNSAAVYVIVYTSDIVQGTLMAEKLRADVEHH